MKSSHALRACMQVLALVDLVFVQMTGAAGTHWLVPLYALTLASPFLGRYREELLHIVSWNAFVVCFFLVLLRHALRADLAYVRESGLVLAALCQVHLLNNLRSNQRPDLFFFNAFLIAIITGFMSRGVGFPLAFLVFVPCFVIGLELQDATRDARVLPPSATRRFVIDGGRRAGTVLVLSLLVFLFWPRDFERKAFFHGRLDLSSGAAAQLEIGFNEELLLGRDEPVVASDRPALRVTLLEGESSDVPSLWRGATLGATDGGAWHAMSPSLQRSSGTLDERWSGRRERLVRSSPLDPTAPGGCRVEVVRFAQDTERLFAPLGARALQIAPEQADVLLRPRLDGTVEAAESGEVRYELTLAKAPDAEPGGRRMEELPAQLILYVELPETEDIARARELASRLEARLPRDAEQHEVVDLLSDHLARTCTYLAPGSEGAARTLDEFLRGAAGGHCEFFASALATMLRSLGIPSRVVTGFRSTRWDTEGRVLSFGRRDAHAWVEVYDPEAGWYAVDPSPMLAGTEADTGLWARLSSRARAAWQSVTGFDAERRAALFAWAGGLPGRIGSGIQERPLSALLALLSLFLPVVFVVRRRRARTPPAVRVYLRAVRRAKLRALPGETPRELLARARSQGLPAGEVQTLEAATRGHESARYAS